MARWSGIVAAIPPREGGGMASRLATHLHPIAGRPVVWHAVQSLLSASPAPDRVLVLLDDLPDDLFHDIPGSEAVTMASAAGAAGALDAGTPPAALLLGASTVPSAAAVAAMLAAPAGTRFASPAGDPAGARLRPGEIEALLAGELPDLTEPPDPAGPAMVVVADRATLAEAGRQVRDSLLAQLMAAGVTFLLPDSVVVDVDVRIGRDSVVYPGAVLEGQTTVGEETVIGPGCRVISSWIGSGVEMKGWNYIAHTSVRNRAILEPYVRRGFD